MSQSAAAAPSEPSNAPPPRRKGGVSWFKIILVLLLLGGAAGGWYWYKKPNSASIQYRTASVGKTNLVQEVTANGSLNPVQNVEVGSQVSGIIEKINVDFNAQVKENEVIAQIDPSTYQQNLVQADAELANSQAALELAEINSKRADQLFKDKLISAADHDATVAALHQAQAVLKTKEASVYRAKVDLSRTTITAPISGVVISRAVDQGQTVAASFNTPRLFVIANDLTKMQIEAAVSEADVGGVEEGQKVSFSVDAFPNRKFFGEVQQVRFAPVTNQNVVTYTAVVGVSNPDLKLRPGMTAVARIITAQRNDVVCVPNAALRFRPPPGAVVAPHAGSSGSTNGTAAVTTDSSGMPVPPWRAEGRRPTPEERQKWEASLTPEQRERMQQMRQQRMAEGGGPGGPGGNGGAPKQKTDGPTAGTIYVLEHSGGEADDKPVLKAVAVKAGVTDGTNTEILEGLQEGQTIVVGIGSSGSASASAEPKSNPFSPFGGGQRRR